MEPKIIAGNIHEDDRGALLYNNNFDVSAVKRIYSIQNKDLDFKRRWQGHKIEQRWFMAVSGSFLIQTIQPDQWEKPSPDLSRKEFILQSVNFDVLHLPAGHLSSIQALEDGSKLLVMADHFLNEIADEYRFADNYFKD